MGIKLLSALAIALAAAYAIRHFAFRPSYPLTIGYSAKAQQAEAPEREQQTIIAEPIVVQFPLDLNTATEPELSTIPGVGNVTSQRIIQYREHIGGYTSLEQLMEISGIGEGTFDTISAYLVLEGDAVDQA